MKNAAFTELTAAAERLSAEFSAPVAVRRSPTMPSHCEFVLRREGAPEKTLGHLESAAREALTLAELRRRFPALGLSFGYVGNYASWGDDRSFYVFTNINLGGTNPLSIPLGTVKEYPANFTVAKVSRRLMLAMSRYEERRAMREGA